MVHKFLSENKNFGKTFIFDNMDYLKIIRKELIEIKDILKVFGIQIPRA